MERVRSRKGLRVALVLLTVALVALAGCNTGGGGSDTTTAPQSTPAPETTDMPGETTDTPDGTPDQTPTETPTDDPDGVSTESLTADHYDQIQSAGTFTSNVSVYFESVENGNTSTLSLVQLSQLNLDDQVGLQDVTSTITSPSFNTSSSGTTYTTGSETFVRVTSIGSNQSQYRYGQEPYNATDPVPINFSVAGGENLFESQETFWQDRGTTTFEGESVQRYTADGVNSMPNLSDALGASFSQIDNVNATLLVTDDGLIRHMNIHIEGQTEEGVTSSMIVTFTISDVGTTTVPTPDWLDEARP